MSHMSHDELRQEIEHQLEAARELGTNVRDVRLDTERFVESVLDIVTLERMKARADSTVQKTFFAAGEERELQRILQYLTVVCEAQDAGHQGVFRAVINELGEKKHREICEK